MQPGPCLNTSRLAANRLNPPEVLLAQWLLGFFFPHRRQGHMHFIESALWIIQNCVPGQQAHALPGKYFSAGSIWRQRWAFMEFAGYAWSLAIFHWNPTGAVAHLLSPARGYSLDVGCLSRAHLVEAQRGGGGEPWGKFLDHLGCLSWKGLT